MDSRLLNKGSRLGDDDKSRTMLKAELWQQLQGLSLRQTLFPSQDRSLDELVVQLEALTPIVDPLASEHQGTLMGEWELVYASQGTVVTRQLAPLTQGFLEGITVKRVWQRLRVDRDRPLEVENGALLEIPGLGRWQLKAEGVWQVRDERVAVVSFNAFSIQAIERLFPFSWSLPELKVPVWDVFRKEAIWITSYLDSDFRIGRGATGNLFVFHRPN